MNTRILIIHPSAIIAEGLQQLLQSSSLQLHDHLKAYYDPAYVNIHTGSHYIFITTREIINDLVKFRLQAIPDSKYRFIQIAMEDDANDHELGIDTIYLGDSQNQIIDKIRSCINSFNPWKNPSTATLTERETEVLKLVSLGNASKEIAEKLNISTHTVITHRKNITEKLGIKSISGLTVYAILNKIIDTGELSIGDLI